MDAIFGIRGKDCVVVAADTTVSRSIFVQDVGYDKIAEVNGDKLIAAGGRLADGKNFTDYLRANLHLNALRARRSMNVEAAASFARTELAFSLRRSPYGCDLLVAGLSTDGTPRLFWIDQLATITELDKAGHKFMPFVAGLMDRLWHHDMERSEVLELTQKCIDQINTRTCVGQPQFIVKVVSKDGIEKLIMSPRTRVAASTTAGRLAVAAA